ncbi:MAG: hypothetical protein OHK0050_05920 [Roseiflexaceae bacterium]
MVLLLMAGGVVSQQSLASASNQTLPPIQPKSAASTAPAQGMWFTNASVGSITATDDTLYIGGTFTQIGHGVEGFAAFDHLGVYQPSFPIDGLVIAMANDGAGGWYVSQRVTTGSNVPDHQLVHIMADQTIDQAWNPIVDGEVVTILADDQRLYLQVYNQQSAARQLQAFDRTLGGEPLWSLPADIGDMAVLEGVVYLSGSFTSIGSPGVTRRYLAAIDGQTGAVLPWNPNPNDIVRTITVDQDRVYVGGDFTDMNGVPQSRLAALDPDSGLVDLSWSAAVDGRVDSISVFAERIYVGGWFHQANSTARPYLAAFQRTTGDLLAWAPTVNDSVSVVVATSQGVYVGGNFSNAPAYLAAFDPQTGNLLPFDARINALVFDVEVNDQFVLAIGAFRGVNIVERSYLAAVDRSTGMITDWEIPFDNSVNELALQGSTLYMTGQFTSVDGVPRNRAAALDLNTSTITAWNPQPNGRVIKLLPDGDIIYLGGEFTTLNDPPVSHRYLAAVDANDGVVVDWDPNPDAVVTDLAMDDTMLFVAGAFANMGSPAVNRSELAAFDRTTRLLRDWPAESARDSNGWSLLIHRGVAYHGSSSIDIATGELISNGLLPSSIHRFAIAADGGRIYYMNYSQFKMTLYFDVYGADLASGNTISCGTFWHQELADGFVRDGLLYAINVPAWYTGDSSTVVALEPSACRYSSSFPLVLQ